MYEGKQHSKPINNTKYQNGQGSYEASVRQPHYTDKFEKVIKEDEFEAGSIFNPGSKKQNLSHLLNFQYEPRGNKNKSNKNNRDSNYNGTARKGAKYYAPRPRYNKEQYLQANCQFVVRKGSDYSRHLKDPDVIVEWENIEQVRLKTTSDVPSCPICLYPPTAAKITKCGHVYCWTCVLHYLSLSDEKWRKCPICFESIRREELKSVISVPWKELKTNDEIEMKLMRRQRDSLFALPVTDYCKAFDDNGHPHLSDKINSYSQLVLASPEQVEKFITSKEQAELEAKYLDLKVSDDPTVCYVEEALNYLSERQTGIIRKLSEASESSDGVRDDTKSPIQSFSPEPEVRGSWINEIVDNDLKPKVRDRNASSSSDGMSASEMDGDGIDEPLITAEDLDISVLQPSHNESNFDCKTPIFDNDNEAKYQRSKKGNDTFYFYQSSDGQPIFLHALNVQMLVKEYGSFEACPVIIKGKILEKDGSNMSEELRNKLRFLRHIPITSSFEVAELAMNNEMVSSKTKEMFSSQIEKRRKSRAQRARAEKRREKRIAVEENKLMGKFPGLPKSLRIESDFHFPMVGITSGEKINNSFGMRSSSESIEDSGSSRNASPRFNQSQIIEHEMKEYGHSELTLPPYQEIAAKQPEPSSSGMSFAKV